MRLEEIQAIEADENGIITIEVDGKVKRFLKEKLVRFLNCNPGTVFFNKPKKKRNPSVKRVPKEKAPKGPDMRGIKNRVAITATMPDGKEIDFPSSRAAIIALKVGKSSISKVLKGHQDHVQNIKFKFQKTA